jgi:hypothetical protein
MKQNVDRFSCSITRLVSLITLITSLVVAPGIVFAMDKDAHHVDRAELRIKEMHNKLKITTDQEEQWAKVAQAMLDDAKNMDALTQARIDRAKDITAIDDLNSYAQIAQAHADGIKNLTPLFTTLYAGMSDAQKKEADTLFRHGMHEHGHRKHGHKKSDDK